MKIKFLFLLLFACLLGGWAAAGSLPEPALETEAETQAEVELRDPFLPPLPAASLEVRYQLTGRYEGWETLQAAGRNRVRWIQAVDTAFGLNRPVNVWILERPEIITSIDLVSGRSVVRANLRGILSRLWQALTEEERLNLAENLEALGYKTVSAGRFGRVTAEESAVLGLKAKKVLLAGVETWFWEETDIILKANKRARGQRWQKIVHDIILDAELAEEAFERPAVILVEEVIEDSQWARDAAESIINLLRRPILYLPVKAEPAEEFFPEEELVASAEESQVVYQVIPWPVPAPPGFRTAAARYRVSPDWRPFPLPPGQRPWPPPGLEGDVLLVKAKDIVTILKESLPRKRLYLRSENMSISD